MANEEIKIVINADDKASGVLSKLSGNVGNLGSALGSLAKIAGVGLVAGFGAMAAAGVSSVKAFIEAEKEMQVATTSLNNTLEEMSVDSLNKLQKEVGLGVDIFKAMEDKMADVGKAAVKLGFDDEEASVAFAKLFSVTNDVTKAQEELKLAMDLSAFSGRSLEESAKAITLVHAGGARVLKEFGIVLDENATAADALAALQSKVTGSAEDMANTMSGKLAILSVSWENLKENVGGVLAEALVPFVEQLSTWAQDPATEEQLKKIAEGFAQFIKQLAPIVKDLLPTLITLLGWVGTGILAVSNFLFKDLPEALGSSIFWVQQMIDKLNQFIDKITEAIRKLKELVSAPSGGTLNPFQENFSLPSWIPKFASGGIVNSPTLAMVGEAGPEAIVPLSKMGSMGGGIVLNITGTFLSEDAADRLADILIDKLKMQLRI